MPADLYLLQNNQNHQLVITQASSTPFQLLTMENAKLKLESAQQKQQISSLKVEIEEEKAGHQD